MSATLGAKSSDYATQIFDPLDELVVNREADAPTGCYGTNILWGDRGVTRLLSSPSTAASRAASVTIWSYATRSRKR
jgi:hypothetical protein